MKFIEIDTWDLVNGEWVRVKKTIAAGDRSGFAWGDGRYERRGRRWVYLSRKVLSKKRKVKS